MVAGIDFGARDGHAVEADSVRVAQEGHKLFVDSKSLLRRSPSQRVNLLVGRGTSRADAVLDIRSVSGLNEFLPAGLGRNVSHRAPHYGMLSSGICTAFGTFGYM